MNYSCWFLIAAMIASAAALTSGESVSPNVTALGWIPIKTIFAPVLSVIKFETTFIGTMCVESVVSGIASSGIILTSPGLPPKSAASRMTTRDGFISTVAAMVAVGLAPQARSYLIPAHRSQERGHHLMLDWLGLEAPAGLDLRLGEETGGRRLRHLPGEAARKILSQMATFTEAGVPEKESE